MSVLTRFMLLHVSSTIWRSGFIFSTAYFIGRSLDSALSFDSTINLTGRQDCSTFLFPIDIYTVRTKKLACLLDRFLIERPTVSSLSFFISVPTPTIILSLTFCSQDPCSKARLIEIAGWFFLLFRLFFIVFIHTFHYLSIFPSSFLVFRPTVLFFLAMNWWVSPC